MYHIFIYITDIYQSTFIPNYMYLGRDLPVDLQSSLESTKIQKRNFKPYTAQEQIELQIDTPLYLDNVFLLG